MKITSTVSVVFVQPKDDSPVYFRVSFKLAEELPVSYRIYEKADPKAFATLLDNYTFKRYGYGGEDLEEAGEFFSS